LGKGINTIIDLTVGTERIVGTIYFSDPDFIDTGNTFINNFTISRNNYPNAGFENREIKNISTIKYEIFDKMSFEHGAEFSQDKVSVNNNSSSIIRTQEGDYLTTRYLYGLNLDNRDKKFKTSFGHTLGFFQGIAIPPSDIPYISNNFYGSFYHRFAEDFQGSIRYKIRSANSLNGGSIKLSNRIFLSDSDMRGFANRGIGPKVNNDFIGGNYAYVSNFSTTFPSGLPDSWNATSNLFFDVGNVWGSDIDSIDNFNKIRSSVGIGFTWSSPLGPIGVSYSEPLSKLSSDKVENFNFRIGSIF